MNKELLLKAILEKEDLKKNYWPEVDTEAINLNTLGRENNKFLKYLHYLLNNDAKSVKINSIINVFQIN